MEEEREMCRGKDRGLAKLGRGKGKNDGNYFKSGNELSLIHLCVHFQQVPLRPSFNTLVYKSDKIFKALPRPVLISLTLSLIMCYMLFL